mgnify:CR=1 FL=1
MTDLEKAKAEKKATAKAEMRKARAALKEWLYLVKLEVMFKSED